jgi:ribosomal protein S18 acetylase RimI-like enzyme
MEIEYKKEFPKNLENFIPNGFSDYAKENGIETNRQYFNFVAKENGVTIGILTGVAFYEEVYVNDLIVDKNHRGKGVGTKLLKAVEDFYKNKGFENINLTTYAFQAPEFYKKLGFEVEFIRENKENSKLTKYFFVKYF